jgi:dihydroorotate dehydrogenase electron transfer subunit
VSAARPVWRQSRARVVRQEDRGAGHRWLELEVKSPFVPPGPGQFVQLRLPSAASPVLLPRPMSVAGVTRSRGSLRLGFLFAPVGAGTLALAGLGAGSEVELLGPLGRGFPLDHPGTPVLLAGGRGVAPLLFAADVLARRARPRRARRPAVLLFGARGRAQLVGLEDAHRRLAALGGRLHVCTDDGSLGPRGDVVQLLERVAPGLAGPLVLHACGPHAMLKAVALWSLARGVPAFLAMESVMACGTGVCRGCPLPRSAAARAAYDPDAAPSLHGNREWAMCCAEGPVFAAEDLDWERIE